MKKKELKKNAKKYSKIILKRGTEAGKSYVMRKIIIIEIIVLVIIVGIGIIINI